MILIGKCRRICTRKSTNEWKCLVLNEGILILEKNLLRASVISIKLKNGKLSSIKKRLLKKIETDRTAITL